MPRLINLVGERYERLVVVRRDTGTPTRWICRCDCGAEVSVLTMCLRAKRSATRSCGCLKRELDVELAEKQTKHGHARDGCTPEYIAWCALIQRCTNPNNPKYADYGGRGITVCARWLESFEAFFEDMGSRPAGMSLDRKDNELLVDSYSKANCRWATIEEQNANKRPRRDRPGAG